MKAYWQVQSDDNLFTYSINDMRYTTIHLLPLSLLADWLITIVLWPLLNWHSQLMQRGMLTCANLCMRLISLSKSGLILTKKSLSISNLLPPKIFLLVTSRESVCNFSSVWWLLFELAEDFILLATSGMFSPLPLAIRLLTVSNILSLRVLIKTSIRILGIRSASDLLLNKERCVRTIFFSCCNKVLFCLKSVMILKTYYISRWWADLLFCQESESNEFFLARSCIWSVSLW